MAETKKLITADERLKAFALFTMAANHYAKAREFEAAVADLLGYDEVYCGCLSDEMCDGGDFERGLKNEGFAVKPPGRIRGKVTPPNPELTKG